jgi:hypothetical protein
MVGSAWVRNSINPGAKEGIEKSSVLVIFFFLAPTP